MSFDPGYDDSEGEDFAISPEFWGPHGQYGDKRDVWEEEKLAFEVFDRHSSLVKSSLDGKTGVPGELEDYLKLSGQVEGVTAEEAFNIFIQRWIDPSWWPHLMDNDDNEAEFVRRFIRGES